MLQKQKRTIDTKKDILLVGNSTSEASGIADKIKHCGYDVVTTDSGKNLLKSIKQSLTGIDLIVIDLGLADNKKEAESIMHMMGNSNLPVLFISSEKFKKDEERMDRQVSTRIMDNSIEMSELDSTIKKALHVQYNNLNPFPAPSESRSRYEMLFHDLDDGIFIFDADTGRLIDANPAITEFTNTSRNQLMGRKFWDIDLLQQIEKEVNFLHEIFIHGSQWFKSITIKTPDNQQKQVDVRGSVYLENGERRFQYTIRNVSDTSRTIKLLENEIEKKEVMARELQHRTKNSFSLICGLTDLKAMSVETKEAKQLLEELSARIQSVAEVYHLLYEDQSSDEVNVHEYCIQIIDSIIGPSESITVKKDIAELRLELKKASSIGLILVEFLFNAIKYAFPESQKGEIEVSLEIHSGKCRLKVADNGIGMPENFTLSRENCSGLYLTQVMAEQLNGTISLESNNGTDAILEFGT